jgi:drug/metabolite transporter (DMT)-like permease
MYIWLVIILTLLTVVGDFFIKKASLRPGFSGIHFLLIASLIWGATAFGWFFLLRKMELSNANAIFAVGTIILTIALSFFYFHEKISFPEIIGFVLAVIAIYLLARFS